MTKLTKEEFIENVKKHGKAPNAEIVGEYTGSKNKIKVFCKKCKNFYYADAIGLYKGNLCPYCNVENVRKRFSKKKLINVERPDLIRFMLNKEDAEHYTPGSGEKIDWVCQSCGKVVSRVIYSVSIGGFNCPACGTASSFGEKVVYCILEILNISFIKSKRFDWAKSEIGGKFHYDFYLPDYSMLIEVMGRQHYDAIGFFQNEEGLEKRKQYDIDKERLAKENGIEHYIKLKYLRKDFEGIMNEIYDSDLEKYFKISSINILEIRRKLNEYDDEYTRCVNAFVSKPRSARKISAEIGLDKRLVKKNLLLANEMGDCDFSEENIAKINKIARELSFRKSPVYQYDFDGNFICEYKSRNDAALALGVTQSAITVCVNGEFRTCGGFILTNKKEPIQKSSILKIQNMKRPCKEKIYQYDYNGCLLKIYDNLSSAKKESGVDNISRAILGKVKLAGGYIWKKEGQPVPTLEEMDFAKRNFERSLEVLQYTKSGYFLKSYLNLKEARAQTGFKDIGDAIFGKRKFSGGYVWKLNNKEE